MNTVDAEFSPTDDDPSYVSLVLAVLQGGDLGGTSLRNALKKDDLTGLGVVPNSLRGQVWAACLLTDQPRRRTDTTAEDLQLRQRAKQLVAELDEQTRDLLHVDAKRTRPNLRRFKGAEDSVIELVELLAYFCHTEKLRYVQGLNELMAIFMLLPAVGTSATMVCSMLSKFMYKYAPWVVESIFEEDESTLAFSGLKSCFKQITTLLLYHDPELYMRLQKFGISPYAFATSWFVTLFARNFSVEATYALWDAIIISGDRSGFHFFALALLLSRRELLLRCSEANLPIELMRLEAQSRREVLALWAWGGKLKKITPKSFVASMSSPFDKDAYLRTTREPTIDIMCIETSDVFSRAEKLPLLVWDCRTEREHQAACIARATFLDIDGIRFGSQGDALANERTLVKANEPMKHTATHICLVGSGVDEDDRHDVIPAAMHLTRNGFRYVSWLKGGFETILRECPDEVVDYDAQQFEAARAMRRRRELRRGLVTPLGKKVPDNIVSLMDRTDEELSMLFTRAKGSIGRIGNDIMLALRPGPFASLSPTAARKEEASLETEEQILLGETAPGEQRVDEENPPDT
mmetsp:Transcript_1179/g.3654  ORF Transcript_1179/g.3654 Transcript_1179/m.3654 type:complete len:578 (+) Transcript_1179:182-1915(+)|eukprot:CAMPEP_0198728612 /NCGR_PEP_ID=MMETSP1475-20131203/10299_1 /TAXON_ID= ORGANISM="Unidentified sp., Strain CCMP1999" /NCGR_SAMPLE_ID=MMETSP1475 /ASSEMBLY_ACC=CAM_ASM_001111 /LENGTH=577 /DNA_ID=CAMNT_0044491025 /DNA_START=134 /DNA_END=1867 /DNA_ORIENTATION=+